MSVVKWKISDGDTTVSLAYNPVTMSTTFRPKNLSVTTPLNWVTMQHSPAQQWTFEGNVYSDTEYDKLVLWHEKDQILELTDHLGRKWRVVSENLNITDRRDTMKNNTRYTYTWTVLNLGPVWVTSATSVQWNMEED